MLPFVLLVTKKLQFCVLQWDSSSYNLRCVFSASLKSDIGKLLKENARLVVENNGHFACVYCISGLLKVIPLDNIFNCPTKEIFSVRYARKYTALTIRFDDLVIKDFIVLSKPALLCYQISALVQENSESKSIKLFQLNLKAKTMERMQSIPALKVPLESQRILVDGIWALVLRFRLAM